LERQSKCSVKCVRSDNGTGFHATLKWLSSLGVQIQKSLLYTPEQNGRAVRAIRTVLESTRTILISSCLPTHLWGEILKTAVILLNNTRRFKEENNPKEKIGLPDVDLYHLRTIGCRTMILVPKNTKQSKLSPKSVEFFLVGYSLERKAWKFWMEKENIIVESRNAIFYQTEF
jgi:hypothetical protein